MRYKANGLVRIMTAWLAMTYGCFGSELVYQNTSPVHVQGSFFDAGDGLYRTQPAELLLDVNADGLADLQFRHDLIPRTRRIDRDGVELLETAEAAIDEVTQLVEGVRQLTVQAGMAEFGDFDERDVAHAQAHVENVLDTASRIANNLQVNDIGLLDGSRGITGCSNALSQPLSL